MASLKAQRLYTQYTKGAARTIDIIDDLLIGKLFNIEIAIKHGVTKQRVSSIKKTFIEPEENK